jgi:hypothetical protein
MRPSRAQHELARRKHERLRRGMHSLREFCRIGDIFFRAVLLNGGQRPLPDSGDAALELNNDLIIDLQQLELLIVPCKLGQEWAFEELGKRLAAHEVTWTQSMLEMVAGVEKIFLDEFPAEAQEPMRSQSRHMVDELAPGRSLERLVVERIRLCWVAEQLLEWKTAEGAKVYLSVRRRNQIGRMLRRTRKWERTAKKMLNALRTLARKKACGRAAG